MATLLERLEDADAHRERYVMGGPRALMVLLRDAAAELKKLYKRIEMLEAIVIKETVGAVLNDEEEKFRRSFADEDAYYERFEKED